MDRRGVDQKAWDAVLHVVLLDPEEGDQVAQPFGLPELDQRLERHDLKEASAGGRSHQRLHSGNGGAILGPGKRVGGEDAHLLPEPPVRQPRAKAGGWRVGALEQARLAA